MTNYKGLDWERLGHDSSNHARSQVIQDPDVTWLHLLEDGMQQRCQVQLGTAGCARERWHLGCHRRAQLLCRILAQAQTRTVTDEPPPLRCKRPRYSAPVEEAVTHRCSLDNQDRAPDARTKMFPWLSAQSRGTHSSQSISTPSNLQKATCLAGSQERVECLPPPYTLDHLFPT